MDGWWQDWHGEEQAGTCMRICMPATGMLQHNHVICLHVHARSPHIGPLPPAVVTHIHNTKMAELATPGRHSAAAQEAPAQQAGQLRRSASDSQLGALRWVDVHSGSSRGDLEPASSSGLGGEQGRQGAPGAAGSGHGRSAATSSSQQQEGWAGSGPQEEQPWWQRLASSLGAAQQQESAMAPVAGCAAPLRRVQSAPELALGQEGGAQYAVPVRMRQRQPQRQQQRGSGRSGKSSSSSSKAQGSKRGGTAGAAAGGSSAAAGGPHEVLPYRLQAVAHSLGAAAVMMYAVVCRMRGQPHRLRRLVLMSPAGFHSPIPGVRRGFGWAAVRLSAMGPVVASWNRLCKLHVRMLFNYITAIASPPHSCPTGHAALQVPVPAAGLAGGPHPAAAGPRAGHAPALPAAALHHLQVQQGVWAVTLWQLCWGAGAGAAWQLRYMYAG